MKILLTINADVDIPAALDPENRTPQELAEAARAVAERVLTQAFKGAGLSLKITAVPVPATRE
ncbi:MAG: hypothetical protein U1G08_18015 [Verrucomicrobiota bacterium]